MLLGLQDLNNPVGLFVVFKMLFICLSFQDLAVRLTDDTDPFFLYNLVISEEDFQR